MFLRPLTSSQPSVHRADRNSLRGADVVPWRIANDETVVLHNARYERPLDSKGKPSPRATCVDPECPNPAPHNGAWNDPCQSRWEDQQRDKAATTAATVHSQKNETSTASTESTCIRCCKALALPYPLGCGGQLCQRCVDLQNAEYRQWVAKQRALGNIPFGNGGPKTRLVR